ncbi:hypothetical protein DXE07_15600 [Vibrio parahaemolyticus]|nr:hypothetical protein [Vibrio parahaemolyticus]TPB67943.1 hypothetical protein DXE07_15600 [Vibrio parahaemolyticus]
MYTVLFSGTLISTFRNCKKRDPKTSQVGRKSADYVIERFVYVALRFWLPLRRSVFGIALDVQTKRKAPVVGALAWLECFLDN